MHAGSGTREKGREFLALCYTIQNKTREYRIGVCILSSNLDHAAAARMLLEQTKNWWWSWLTLADSFGVVKHARALWAGTEETHTRTGTWIGFTGTVHAYLSGPLIFQGSRASEMLRSQAKVRTLEGIIVR